MNTALRSKLTHHFRLPCRLVLVWRGMFQQERFAAVSDTHACDGRSANMLHRFKDSTAALLDLSNSLITSIKPSSQGEIREPENKVAGSFPRFVAQFARTEEAKQHSYTQL